LARLNFGRSAFAKWCADWSWYAPASPDVLVSGFSAGKDGVLGLEPSRIGGRETAPVGPAVVALATACGRDHQSKVDSRPGRRDRRNTAQGLPLFDNSQVVKAAQLSIEEKVACSATIRMRTARQSG
jgi:hypothetical protein